MTPWPTKLRRVALLSATWSVKQSDEGPVEVMQSRILSAVGYHQPLVYFLESFTLRDDNGTHEERGGRFRPTIKPLEDIGDWSWQQNPFVGTKPYHGWHQELFRGRITHEDVRWACDLMSRLTDAQWEAAFRTAGYDPAVAARFVAALKSRIDQGRHIAAAGSIR